MTTGIRRYWWLLAGLVLLLVVGVVVRHVTGDDEAAPMRATASSSARGHGPNGVLGGAGWRSDDETTGSWVQLDWSGTTTVRRVVLDPDTAAERTVLAGFLTFGDGSQVQVRFPRDSGSVAVPVTSRSVDSVRFTVSEVADGATSVGMRALRVEADEDDDSDVATDAPQDGDVVLSARLSGSSSSELLAPLVDGSSDPARIEDPEGAWVQLDWPQPRELTTITVAGATGGSTLASGTLEFADGSTLAMGAVLADPRRPTIVSFMPHVTTSVRLVIDSVAGDGDLPLAELAAYQRGAPALHASGDGDVPAESTPTDCAAAPPSEVTGLVVLCPDNGGQVDDTATVRVAVAANASVTASVWPSDEQAPVIGPVNGVRGTDGTASLDLDVSDLPAGPFTVHVAAAADGETIAEGYAQLDREGTPPTDAKEPGPAGRSLAYEEEFDGPLSISRDGTDADYAAGKPVAGGVEDFGDAPFADPAAGLGNIAIDHADYLRLTALPAPADTAYPEGGMVGAMLASARPGGSGFSAQYGYFEARMLLPAAPGTWPAFWMLPGPNLVADQPFVAEIDAVEHYGHNPTGACHSTHQYPDPDHVGIVNCGERWDTARDALGWHTYGADVQPDGITFFIDGHQVASAPQVKGGDQALFFMVDLALGGGWPVDLSATRDRADLYVDWIRVYV